MKRVVARGGGLAILALALSAGAASAQEGVGAAAVTPPLQVSLEGAAALQVHYHGSTQSIALGLAPGRSLTLLLSAERSYVADRIERYEDGYSSERGGTEHFFSAGVRYAFLPARRVSPYALGGIGRGISRPTVNEYFPDTKKRDIQMLYYGGGVRVAVRPRLDAFVDARLIMAVEARSDYFAVRLPVRAGLAWRF